MYVILAVIFLGFALLVVYIVRQRRNRSPAETLESASDPGGDIAYRYYVDEDGLRALASELRIDIPVRATLVESDSLAVGLPHGGPQVGSRQEHSRELPAEINLAALARRLRRLGAQYVASDLALMPVAISEAELLDQKVEQLREAAAANRVVIMRGHFDVESFERDGQAGPIHVRLTHLSSEVLDKDTYPGTGNAAARAMPPGLTIRAVLPSPEKLADEISERFARGEPFFGEVLAHSPSFSTETSTFACTSWALWGCPSPTETEGRDGGVAY